MRRMSVIVRSICGSSSTISTLSASACEDVIKDCYECLRSERLLDAGVYEALGVTLAVAVGARLARAKNQGHARAHPLYRNDRFLGSDSLEPQVEHDRRRMRLLDRVERFLEIRRLESIVPSLLEALAEISQQRDVVGDEQHWRHLLRRCVQHLDQPSELHRLRQHLERSLAFRLGDYVGGGVGRHQHHPDVRADSFHLAERHHAVDARHLHVHQNGVVGLLANFLNGGFPAVSAGRFPTVHADNVGESTNHLPLIVYDENLAGHDAAVATGRSTDTVDPFPASLDAEITAPFASARLRDTARPSPMPRAFVVNRGSNILSSCSRVMPTPVSITSSLTLPLPLWRPRRVRVPAFPSIACSALVRRLSTT